MPQYTFTPAQVDALVTALLAQTERARTLPDSLRVPGKHESNYRPAGKAGELLADMNCFSFHAINGRGGRVAPDLTWEGGSVQRRWLVHLGENCRPEKHPNSGHADNIHHAEPRQSMFLVGTGTCA